MLQSGRRIPEAKKRRRHSRFSKRTNVAPARRVVRKRSKVTIGGFPLWEVAVGPDHRRGERRGHARAILALGDVADGVVAIGGLSRGVISVGGLAAGVIVLGGVSVGLLAALGGLAAAPYAMGGVALGAVARGGAYASIRTGGKLVRSRPWWRQALCGECER